MHANRKTAYINGKIFTSDRENLHAEAMTVENGRITWVGAQADLPAGPYDETVDLQGRRVLPGFVDAHEHPVMLADFSKKISSLRPRSTPSRSSSRPSGTCGSSRAPASGLRAGAMTRASWRKSAPPPATIWTRGAL